MGRLIVVSCACQSDGIASALEVIFPQDVIFAAPERLTPDQEVRLTHEMQRVTGKMIWVLSDHESVGENPDLKPMAGQIDVLRVPFIFFRGFHPDVTYATKGGALIRIPISPSLDVQHGWWAENSALVLWAWKHRLTVDDAIALFDAEVFRALGYFDNWADSVRRLRARFDGCGMSFPRFFQACKQRGPFMMSFNHPRIHALTELSKQLAVRLGAAESVFDLPLHDLVPDELSLGPLWPIYPEIAEALGYQSCYVWRLSRHFFLRSVADYVRHAYASYAAQAIAPADIVCQRFESGRFDRVLGSRIRAP